MRHLVGPPPDCPPAKSAGPTCLWCLRKSMRWKGVSAMKLPKDRNDRVMVGMGSALAGLAVAVVLTSVVSDPQFSELCSAVRIFGSSASAAEEPSKPRIYRAQP